MIVIICQSFPLWKSAKNIYISLNLMRNFNFSLAIFFWVKYLDNILFVRSTCKQQDKKVNQRYRTNCDQNKQVTGIRALHGLFDCRKINGVGCNKKFSSKRCQVITEALQVRAIRFVAYLWIERKIMIQPFQLIPLEETDHYAMCNEIWKLNVKEISSLKTGLI